MSDLAKGPNATKEDKNPKGGLSAKGRKKFGVQKGVTNYSSASRKDKGRWVSWALRFTGTPKPVKDSSGNPTRYALMFRAWGEKVPTSRADVTAVHKKAMKRSQELKNADKASLEERTDDFSEDLACADCDRSFLIYNTLLNHIDDVHLETAMEIDSATLRAVEPRDGFLECPDGDCARSFRDRQKLVEHAEAVHTFDDIRQLLSEHIREKYNEEGDYRASPPVSSTWSWIQDLASDWVVFSVEKGTDTTLLKASYAVTDGSVTLGEPVEVRRRTVYEPVKKESDS